jgi:predicted metallo-beta-lactamase superfamily hydrolase
VKVTILAAESMGVRSMATVVDTPVARILIDPGVALAPKRAGLKAHRTEMEAALAVQRRLRNELNNITHSVITHFHGDHHPMMEADDSQLSGAQVLLSLQDSTLLAIGKESLSRNQSHRRFLLQRALGRKLPASEGTLHDAITLSRPVPHGDPGARSGSVMMCRVHDGDEVFVHASDIQFLDDTAVAQIIDWTPTLVFASGPPVYLLAHRPDLLARARERIVQVARTGARVVLDHHLMRSREGASWLDALHRDHPSICCAADYAGQPRQLLEATRKQLWAARS